MKRWMGFAVIGLAAILLAAAAFCLRPRAADGTSEALERAAEGLDEIVMEARLDPDRRALSVRQTLTLRNRTGRRLDAAVLRTWANAFQSEETSPCASEERTYEACYPEGFSAGALLLQNAWADGQLVLTRYQDEAQTVLAVPVPGGWQPEQLATLTLEYTVVIPEMAYRFGVWNGVFCLGNAFAIPAVWEDGAFRTDAYAPVGDPFVSDCANYHVRVTLPRGYRCVGSGRMTEEKDGTFCFEAPAARDFALVCGDRLASAQKAQDGVLITACAADGAAAQKLLTYSARALRCFSKLYGAYAYPAYTAVMLPAAMGDAEYPGLCLLGQADGRELEYAAARQTAHQWWYAAVGSDGWNQPWQHEALCEFALLQYAQDTYGAGERYDLEHTRVEPALRMTVSQGATPGAPLSAFGTASEYAHVVCNRGAACVLALDRTVKDGLNGFLRAYYQRYLFARATREDFETLLFQITGADLTPLLRDYLDTNLLN